MNISVATIEATLRSKVTVVNQGEVLIPFNEKGLSQMDQIAQAVIKISGLDENNLTELDLRTAEEFSKIFDKSTFSQSVVDGQFVGMSDEQLEVTLSNISQFGEAVYKPGVALPVVLLSRILNDVRQAAMPSALVA